jgi:hypothetical protein
VGVELFHADKQAGGQTDRRDEANSPFRNFANTPKKKILRGGWFRMSVYIVAKYSVLFKTEYRVAVT